MASDTSTASPSASASAQRDGSEALSAAELRHRKELEYEEAEDREDSVMELKHASLEIPSIPLPRSSDGNVSDAPFPRFLLALGSLTRLMCDRTGF